MARRYQARNVREAIQIARRLCDEGAYDWFRGQREDWPLKSSFARLSGEQEEQALAQAERFISWAQATPGLETLVGDVDATCAVGQHYGVPTNYIDFTVSPEVAGFFATDNPSGRPVTRPSCIFCLNTADLKQFWRHMPPNWPSPEFIEIQVPNLWRLEAQEGRFLFCGAENFEEIYDLDKIVFPYTACSDIVPREKIYPTQKSALEILLDHFFMNERRAVGDQIVRKMPWKRIRFEDTGGWNPELTTSEVPLLPSWQSAGPLWIETRAEPWAQIAAGPIIRLEVSPRDRPQDASARLEQIVAAQLRRDTQTRGTSVSWHVNGEVTPAGRSHHLVTALRWLWDGMRNLPYTADQLAAASGQCLALWQAGADGSDHDAMSAATNRCFGKAIEVEFGAADGAYSKAFVSEASVLRAARPDIGHYLDPGFRDAICASASGLLTAVREPSRLFEFPLLADLFARELIPSQVLYRQGAKMVLFSPARLRRLGLP